MDLWKRLHALTVAWILTLVAPLPARAELRLTHRSERLRNGLTVILFEDHRAPVVTVAVRHLAGAGRDPEGRSGLAHLVEHLLSGKTAHMERQQRAEYYLHRMAPLAANALTSHDFAYYYETIPVGNLALALWLESERMRYALDDLDAEALNRERDIVRNESRQRSQLSSYGAGFEALFQAVFPAGHPYHRSVGGAPEDLQRITEGDVRAFYQRNYGPSGAVLLVGGDINLSDAAALVRRYFDDLPPSAPLPPLGTPPPRPCARQEIAAPSAAWPALLLGWPTPPLLSKEDALGALVAALLSRNGRGRLDRRVRALGLQGSLAVEPLQVAEVAAPYLKEETYQLAIVGDEGVIRSQVPPLGLGPLRFYRAADLL